MRSTRGPVRPTGPEPRPDRGHSGVPHPRVAGPRATRYHFVMHNTLTAPASPAASSIAADRAVEYAMREPICIGVDEWKPLAECTESDLRSAARELREQAFQDLDDAAVFERLASVPAGERAERIRGYFTTGIL